MEGTYRSMFFDAGCTTPFGTATWAADVPVGTSLRFQVDVSSTASGPWVFVGPDGTAGSYFTSSGTAFTTPPTGRYVCYRATFASDVARLASPTFSGFNVSLGGATSRVVSYTYGPHGSVVARSTVDSATGMTTDVRDRPSDRISAQNQLLRRDVTSPDRTTVIWRYTWRYTYDSAGNMTSKTDGTQTTPYAWDSHNRQVQVTQPDGTTEAYTCDVNGLMLSSRRSTDTAATAYVWRGNDLVQETTPAGTVTRNNVVNGVPVSFERGGETYTVQSDATPGQVRSVTDSDGTVVYTARYNAGGNVLAVTCNAPGGRPYSGVKTSQGVRVFTTMRERATRELYVELYEYASKLQEDRKTTSVTTTSVRMLRLVLDELALKSASSGDCIRIAVNLLVPSCEQRRQLHVACGCSISRTWAIGLSDLQISEGKRALLCNWNGPTGWACDWWDRQGPKNQTVIFSDQPRHLITFLYVGWYWAPTLRNKVVRMIDEREDNLLGIVLGDLGVFFGSRLAASRIETVSMLCDMLEGPWPESGYPFDSWEARFGCIPWRPWR